MENEVIETVETTEEVATDFTEETDVATSDTNVTEEVVETTVEQSIVKNITPAV